MRVQPPIWSFYRGKFVRFIRHFSNEKFCTRENWNSVLFPWIHISKYLPRIGIIYIYIGDFTRTSLNGFLINLQVSQFVRDELMNTCCNHWMWHSRWIFMPHLNVVARYYRAINSLDRSASSYAKKKWQKKQKKRKKRDATLELKTLKYLL